MKKIAFVVKETTPLLRCLSSKIGIATHELKILLDNNLCFVNGKIERFGRRLLLPGDEVVLLEDGLLSFAKNTVKILYENADFLCIDKKSGDVSAPLPRSFLVHRLDKGTSGVLLLAKTQEGKRFLDHLFKTRRIKKRYFALTQNCPRQHEGQINHSLGKIGEFSGQTLYGIKKNGVSAITHYRVVKQIDDTALLDLQPITGRTHQIRVHLASIGTPILGDGQYGREMITLQATEKWEVNRLALHAYSLSFVFQEKNLIISSPLPAIFSRFYQHIS